MSALGERTSPEVSDAHPVLLVPLGSCEQHGPHLPLDTDTRIAVAVATGVADAVGALPPVMVAPALAYGASGEHAAFAGTLSIGLDAVERVLVELGRSADHFAGVVLVNGHGGNSAAVEEATRQLLDEGRPVVAWFPDVEGGDAHAGRTETSLMLAIAPELVRVDRAESGCTEPLASIMPVLQEHGVVALSTNGVLGDPAGASAEEGSAILARLVDDLARVVAALP